MLTDSAIRAAKSKIGRTAKLSDGGGLQLWVQPWGSKLWNLAYRFAGKQRKLAIGSYPGSLGCDLSQQKRLGKMASENQRADTFAAISREVLEKKRREGKSETTVKKAEWLFDLATPALGPRPIAEITAAEVLSVLRQVETRGRLETARRLRAIIGQAFRFSFTRRRTRERSMEAIGRVINQVANLATRTTTASLRKPRQRQVIANGVCSAMPSVGSSQTWPMRSG